MSQSKRKHWSSSAKRQTCPSKRRGAFSRTQTPTSAQLHSVSQGVPHLAIVGFPLVGTSPQSSHRIDHFGVVKAFLEANLLPRVISGTSAGGLVAALVCTRTDAELRELLIPELANRITACEEPFKVWFKRFWHTGARFDSVAWAKKVSKNNRMSVCPSLTYGSSARSSPEVQ